MHLLFHYCYISDLIIWVKFLFKTTHFFESPSKLSRCEVISATKSLKANLSAFGNTVYENYGAGQRLYCQLCNEEVCFLSIKLHKPGVVELLGHLAKVHIHQLALLKVSVV